MIFPHTVTVHPSTQDTDSDGNLVRRPQPVGVPARAFVQAGGAGEDLTNPQASTSTRRVWLHPSCPPLDAYAVLVWRGERFELLGDALWRDSPDGNLNHWTATLRKAT